MFERPFLRLMIGMGLPIASAVLVEQLPKAGVAQIPFAFQVEGRTLPPGSYTVKNAGRTVHIQSENVAGAGLSCIAAERKFGTSREAGLVFGEYGGRYFLTQIWLDSDGRGLILQPGRLKPEAASSPDGRAAVRYIRFQ
jgi:hypothetical protein